MMSATAVTVPRATGWRTIQVCERRRAPGRRQFPDARGAPPPYVLDRRRVLPGATARGAIAPVVSRELCDGRVQ
jgi:hypothetical protein